LLHVSDMVEIKNESSPPLTEAGERTFEVYLPANAKIDSVLAAGPGEMGVMISAVPVPDEPGHYAVNFPLRREQPSLPSTTTCLTVAMPRFKQGMRIRCSRWPS